METGLPWWSFTRQIKFNGVGVAGPLITDGQYPLNLLNMPDIMVYDDAKGVSKPYFDQPGYRNVRTDLIEVFILGSFKQRKHFTLLVDERIDYGSIQWNVNWVHGFECFHFIPFFRGQHAFRKIIAHKATFKVWGFPMVASVHFFPNFP